MSTSLSTATPVATPIPATPTSCTAVTSDGTALGNQVAKFTAACNIEPSAITESGGLTTFGTGALDYSSSDSLFATPNFARFLSGSNASPATGQTWLTPDFYLSRVEQSTGAGQTVTAFNSNETALMRLVGLQTASSTSSFTPFAVQLHINSTNARGNYSSFAMECENFNNSGVLGNNGCIDANVWNRGGSAGIVTGLQIGVNNQVANHTLFSNSSGAEERGILIGAPGAGQFSPSIGFWIDTRGGLNPFSTGIALTGVQNIGIQVGPSHWGGDAAMTTGISIPGPATTGICVGSQCPSNDATATAGANPTYAYIAGKQGKATSTTTSFNSNLFALQTSSWSGAAELVEYFYPQGQIGSNEATPQLEWFYKNNAGAVSVLFSASTTALTIPGNTRLVSNAATGTAPLVINSTTPVSNLYASPIIYSSAGTQQTSAINQHVIVDRTALVGGTKLITFSGSAAFTGSGTYNCTANDATAQNAVWVTYTSGTSVTFHGTGTDGVSFICVGD